MLKIINTIDNLNRLSDEDKAILNKLLIDSKDDLLNKPIDTIIECFKELIKAKEEVIMNAMNNKEITNEKVKTILDQRKLSHSLFLDKDFISWAYIFTLNPFITRENMYEKYKNRGFLIDEPYFDKVSLFFNGLYDYAIYMLNEKGIDYINEDDGKIWINVSYNDEILSFYAHPNSSVGTTFCRSLNITDEEIINFSEIREYFTKINKEEENSSFQRKRNNE